MRRAPQNTFNRFTCSPLDTLRVQVIAAAHRTEPTKALKTWGRSIVFNRMRREASQCTVQWHFTHASPRKCAVLRVLKENGGAAGTITPGDLCSDSVAGYLKNGMRFKLDHNVYNQTQGWRIKGPYFKSALSIQ